MNFLIGIPCLFDARITKECVDSVIHKGDLLLIDNGAEESVKELLKQYESPNVIVIHNKVNIYVNPALNQCLYFFLEHKNYDYLILMNSDLILHKSWAVVVGNRLILNPDESCMPEITRNKSLLEADIDANAVKGAAIEGGVNGAFMILNRKQAEIVTPIPAGLLVWYGDSWIYEILRNVGYKTVMSNNFLGYHYVSQCVPKVPGISHIIEQDKLNWQNIAKTKMPEIIKKNTN